MNKFNKEITELSVKSNSEITLVQITDTHILDEGATSFDGYDTAASLNKVIEKIKTNEKNADLLLLTGDLVHEPTQSSYQKLADCLHDLTIPLYCLPGNHDEPDMLDYVMGMNGVDSNRLIKIGNWLIILLNSHLPGEHSGQLSETELHFLQSSLAMSSEPHVLIALHHHPVSINSTWMDSMSLLNQGDFLSIADQHEQIKAIIWGHIHQEFEINRNNVKLLGTPSTCLQFVAGSDAFAVDDKTPAYRKINLFSNGEIETTVFYL